MVCVVVIEAELIITAYPLGEDPRRASGPRRNSAPLRDSGQRVATAGGVSDQASYPVQVGEDDPEILASMPDRDPVALL